MYIPKHFAKKDKNEIAAFIHANAFGQLLSQHACRLCAAHIPFVLSDDNGHIYGHLARQNPTSQFKKLKSD